MRKIFIIGLLLFILYNMFSTWSCVPFFCFLNQREGLTADRDTIAKNTADITTITNNINAAVKKITGWQTQIKKTAATTAKNKPEYALLPGRSLMAELKLEGNPDWQKV